MRRGSNHDNLQVNNMESEAKKKLTELNAALTEYVETIAGDMPFLDIEGMLDVLDTWFNAQREVVIKTHYGEF